MSRLHFRFRGVRINIDEAEVDVEGPAAAGIIISVCLYNQLFIHQIDYSML